MPRRLASSFGQVVLGPPGSGKTTYTRAALEVLSHSRKTCVVNLDPANESAWTGSNIINIRQLITAEDAAYFHKLGPNASFIFCLEFLDSPKGREWLVGEMLKKEQGTYFLFDLPGQVELVTHHPAISNVIKFLCNVESMRLVAVHLVDCQFATDGAKFVSVALLSLSTMMRLGLPHINVLSKADMLDEDQLAFNLSFYTEHPNFERLAKTIHAPTKYRKLTDAICELLDDCSQVAFKLVSVNSDDDSLLELLAQCDRACGYLPLGKS